MERLQGTIAGKKFVDSKMLSCGYFYARAQKFADVAYERAKYLAGCHSCHYVTDNPVRKLSYFFVFRLSVKGLSVTIILQQHKAMGEDGL